MAVITGGEVLGAAVVQGALAFVGGFFTGVSAYTAVDAARKGDWNTATTSALDAGLGILMFAAGLKSVSDRRTTPPGGSRRER